MGNRRYTAVFPDGRRELVVIDESDTVMGIRALMEAMLGVELDSTKELTISCQGKRLRDSMGTWEAAMSYLFPQRFVSADQEDATRANRGVHDTEKEDGKEKTSQSTTPRPLASFSFLSTPMEKGSSVDGKCSVVGEAGKRKEMGEVGASTVAPVCDPFLLKFYCAVGEKDVSSEISLEAIRDVLPENQRASQEEREHLRQMLEPSLNLLAENPEIFKKLLQAQGLNVNNPALKQVLQNKEMMKMALSASYDPDAQRRIMQEGTLQLAQAQAHPDIGFVVNSMVENSVKEFMDSEYAPVPPSVSEEDEDDEDEDEDSNKEHGDKQNPSGSRCSHSRDRKKKVRFYRLQKEAMPNPWAKKDPPPSQSPLNNGFNFPFGFPLPSSVPPSMSAEGLLPFGTLPDMNRGGGSESGGAAGRGNSTNLFPSGMESLWPLFAPPAVLPGAASTTPNTNFGSHQQHSPNIMDYFGGNVVGNNNSYSSNSGEPVSNKFSSDALSFLMNSFSKMPPAPVPSTSSSPPLQMGSPENFGGSGYLPSSSIRTTTATATSSTSTASGTSSLLEGPALFNSALNTLLNEFGFSDKKLCEEALKVSAGNLEGALAFLERKQEEEEEEIERKK